MPETEHSDVDSLTDEQPPKSKTNNKQRGFQSKTSSLSIEITDPNDNFDPNENLSFDLKFLRRFLKLQKLLFVRIGSLSTALFVTVVLFTLLQEYVVYQVGLIPSQFYKVLGDKDWNDFVKISVQSFGIIVAISLVKSSKQYLLKLLTVTWRQILCKKLHSIYFTDITYYQLNVLDKKIDNPDQRITQDVDKFTASYCEILPRIIVAPVVLGYYTYKGFVSTGWQGPVGCFVFFLIGTVFNKLLMGPIVQLVAQQEKCEGDFRFVHMQVRVNSESIAFHDAALVEGNRADAALLKLATAQHKLYLRQFLLNISINLFDYLGSIVSYFIIAVPVFAGAYDDLTPSDISALISKNSFITMYLIYQFSQLVDISVKVTDVAGVTHRISQIIERMGYLQSYWRCKFLPDDPNFSNLNEFEKLISKREDAKDSEATHVIPTWILDNVSFTAPNRQRFLAKDLSMTISTGQSVLIVGGSSAGKTSLLRILRGLWPYCNGKITRLHPPGCQGAFYVPQKPFLTTGTLREQFTFPCEPNGKQCDDNELLGYIRDLKLNHLLERCGSLDEPVPWNVYESLSPGETQRIYFIRLFLHRPVIALLDEATSALPMEMEDRVYRECQRLGITLISVGHRESLRQYHDFVLSIGQDGSWTLNRIDHP